MKQYEVELCYAWQETEDGIFHAFEVVGTRSSIDHSAIAKKLAGLLDTTPDDERFDWNSMRVSLPESVVTHIQSEAAILPVKHH